MLFAAERANDWDLAVFVHVLGAMILVGGAVTAAAMAVIGWRDESSDLRRRSTKTLLVVALPGYLIMRIAAEWAYATEGWDEPADDDEPAWLGIGYITADLGGLLLLIALILGGIGIRRDRTGGGGALLRISGAIADLPRARSTSSPSGRWAASPTSTQRRTSPARRSWAGPARAIHACMAAEFRLSEVIAALSHALDLTEGQPQGHAARTLPDRHAAGGRDRARRRAGGRAVLRAAAQGRGLLAATPRG